MKTKEYLVTYKHYQTLEVIDTFYINANNMTDAKQIANDLTHDYEDTMYFEIVVSVELA